MLLICYGFRSQVSKMTYTRLLVYRWHYMRLHLGLHLQRDALAFEWAWQHPLKSKAVRDMAGTLKKREMAGAKGKVCTKSLATFA